MIFLDPGTGTLQYANAGHTWPVLLGDHAVVLKPNNGMAIGLFEDAGILDENMTLPAGRGMILYTDGVTDALNAERSAFGMERLLDVLADDSHAQNPAEEVMLRVNRAVNDYCGDVEPFDDMAILVLFMTGVQSEDFS